MGIAEHVPESCRERGTYLEIGAGYGRFASLVLTAHRDARVVIGDIPPALALSEAYLTACHPEATAHRFTRGLPTGKLEQAVADSRLLFLTPNQFATLGPIGADVVINVSSLHEMMPNKSPPTCS